MRKPFLSEVDKDFLRGLPLAGLVGLAALEIACHLRLEIGLIEALWRIA